MKHKKNTFFLPEHIDEQIDHYLEQPQASVPSATPHAELTSEHTARQAVQGLQKHFTSHRDDSTRLQRVWQRLEAKMSNIEIAGTSTGEDIPAFIGPLQTVSREGMSTTSTQWSIPDHTPNHGKLIYRQPCFSRLQTIMAVACALLLIAGIIASLQVLSQRMSSVSSTHETAGLYVATQHGDYYHVDSTTHQVIWHRYIPTTGDMAGLFPIVAQNGLLYTLTSEDPGSVFYALNPSNGSTRWSTPAIGKVDLNNLFVGPNTIITNDMLYFSVFSPSQGYSVVHALNALTGKEVWQYPLYGTGVVGMNLPNGDVSAGITLQAATSDVLYATKYTGPYYQPTTTLYALDLHHQGQILWQQTIITGGHPDFGGVVINGVLCLASTQQNNAPRIIYGYDASTGTPKWSVPVSGQVFHLIASNGVLYAGTGRMQLTPSNQPYFAKGDVYALRADGTMLWHYSTQGMASDPAIKDGEVYFTSVPSTGNAHIPLTLTALDAATGRLRWSQSIPDSGGTNLAPVASDSFLYLPLFNNNGTVKIFTLQDGQPAGSFSVPTTMPSLVTFFLTIAP